MPAWLTGPTYVGVEPDAQSCAVARERIEPRGGTVVQGTDRDLEPGRPSTSCAPSRCSSTSRTTSPRSGLGRAGAPGGHLLLSVPADQKRFGPMDELVGHFRRYDEDQLAACARQAGLSGVHDALRLAADLRPGGRPQRPGRPRRDRRMTSRHPRSLAASGRTFQPAGSVERTGRRARHPALPLPPAAPPTAGTGLVLVASRT